MSEPVDLLIEHAAQLVRVRDTGAARRGPEQGRLDDVADGAVAVRDGLIVAAGSTAEVRAAVTVSPSTTVIDARGKTVMPGLVDSHTHPIFGGLRHDEYAMRLGGATIDEIFAAGGGMHRSVRETRAASDETLLRSTIAAFDRMLDQGTTTVEAKSGYGLSLDEELRSLRLLGEARAHTALDVVISFLGAHFVPEDHAGRRSEYARLIAEEMIPAVAEQGLAEFCDGSWEEGAFTAAEMTRIFDAARARGLKLRCHIDNFEAAGGWEGVTAVPGMLAAEHVTGTPDAEIRKVGATNVIANLLPGAELVYRVAKRANARLLIETGVPVAISTDYCSSIHVSSLQACVGLATAWFGMTPAEAVVGATINGAYSLGRERSVGSLDPGKQADILVLNVPHVNVMAWGFGTNYVDTVIKRGRVVVARTTTQQGE